MKIYTVHMNPKADQPLEEIVLIKEGFSWMGSMLNFIWAFYHKMWLVGFVLIALEIFLSFLQLQGYCTPQVIQSIRFGILLLIGSNFNDLYRHYLTSKNYIFHGVVSGANEDEARYKFITNMLQRNMLASGNGQLSLV